MNGKTPRPLTEQAMQAFDSNPGLAALEAWMSFNRPMFAAVTDLQGRLVDQVSKANNELLGFVNRRLNDDIATTQRLLECRTLQDLFSTYSDFFHRAQQQYEAEFQFFTRLNQKLADETATVMRARVEEMHAEVRH